jgi:acyl-CoA reductase-like NAD-dependent aldehyde dehydrogenase
MTSTTSRRLSTGAEPPTYGLFIGGASIPARSGQTMDVFCPADGRVIARVLDAGPVEVDIAVGTAREALNDPAWRNMSVNARGKLVYKLAEVMEKHLEELFELETLNNGRPIRETRAQISRVPEFFRYNAALAMTRRDSMIPVDGSYLTYTRREPVGVVANIAPFNHPLLIAVRNLAPTFASGCTTVVKPSEYTPLTILRLAELFASAGLPPGVFNVVTGSGGTAGKALSEHPGLNKLVLTGSTESGRLAGTAAVRNFAKSTLELGGKTPVLVFDDFDVDQSVDYSAFGAFIGAVPTCACAARHIVHRKIYDEFVEKLARKAEAIRVGDPFAATTQMGPMISQRQRQRVLDYVRVGLEEGGRLVAGGHVPSGLVDSGGFYMEPTVFADVAPHMRIAREEVFGPFTVVMPFDTEEEALQIANDSVFGLSAAIRTTDLARAHRLAAQLEVGVVWINDHHRIDPASPWGGIKSSGMGREYGSEAFNEYFSTKVVMANVGDQRFDWYGETGYEMRLN